MCLIYIYLFVDMCACVQCSIADVGITNMDSIVIRIREGYQVGTNGAAAAGAAGAAAGGGGKKTGSRSGTRTGQKATAGSKRTASSSGVVSIADVGTNRKARRVPKRKFPGRGEKLGTESARADDDGGQHTVAGAAIAGAEVRVLWISMTHIAIEGIFSLS